MRINKLLLNPASFFLFFILLAPAARGFEPSAADLEMLTKVERASILYFVKLSDKKTGFTKDSSRPGSPASIAATGFALASVAIGQSRGWLDPEQSYKQIEKTLQALLHKAEHKNGFFYHFLDMPTGKRVWSSEASSIDTALLVAGALVAAQYYPGTDIERMANKIYTRVDWKWMMNGSDFVCMGWKPESGFLPYYWDSYNELIILQALALGSPRHPIPPGAWERWMRHTDEYNGHRVVYSGSGSLFTYQFAQAFIDFKSLDDNGVNYFENSVAASLANRDYSLYHRAQHRGYTENSWGLSASVGPGGYKAYGGKPGGGEHDGTIAPYAAVSSIVFTPEESINAIRHFYFDHGKNIFGIFGFKDAFNIDKAWWAEEYLGIDQGISVLMLENYLNDGIIWKKFMRLEAVERWIKVCGLRKEKKVTNAAAAEKEAESKELLMAGETKG